MLYQELIHIFLSADNSFQSKRLYKYFYQESIYSIITILQGIDFS